MLIANGTMIYLNRYARRNGRDELVKLLDTHVKTDLVRNMYWLGIITLVDYVILFAILALSFLVPSVYNGMIDVIVGEMSVGLFTFILVTMSILTAFIPYGVHFHRLVTCMCDGRVKITSYESLSGQRRVDWSKTSNHY